MSSKESHHRGESERHAHGMGDFQIVPLPWTKTTEVVRCIKTRLKRTDSCSFIAIRFTINAKVDLPTLDLEVPARTRT